MARRRNAPGSVPVVDASAVAKAASLTPSKAVAWLRSLGLEITWDWRDDWRLAQEQAFTVRKVTDLQVLGAIRDEVAAGVERGVSQVEMRRLLAARLASLGWYAQREVATPDGRFGTVDLSRADRLNVIFRTNAQGAYMAGRYETQLANVDQAPFWQYVAVMDGRTRPAHAALNGLVARWDDPIWRTIYPPNGFNCRCRVRTLTAADVEQRGLRIGGTGTTTLPAGFPDAGFAQNPGLTHALDSALRAIMGRAATAANQARTFPT